MSVDNDFHVYADMVKVLDKTFANPFDDYLVSLQDPQGWIPICDIAVKISNGPILKFVVSPAHIKHALKNHFSQNVEMDAHEICVRRKPIDLMIKQKIHHWFSDRNLSRDLYLHQIAEENQGMVPLRALVGFPSMFQSLEGEYPAKSIDYYIDVLCRVLADSDEVEVIPCQEPMICRRSLGERVRRKIDQLFQDSSNSALHELVSESIEGYVPLSQVLCFPNIIDTVKPCVAAVAKAMQLSCVVEVSADGLHIRKRNAAGLHVDDDTYEPEVSDSVPAPAMPQHLTPQPPTDEHVGFLSAPFTCNSPAEFSVVQFNMLAKFLCTEEYYPYCKPKYLKWNYRRRLLEEGLIRVNADIICLEEVQGSTMMDPSEFNDHAVYLRNLGARLGYDMIYCMKTKADGTQNKMSMGNALLYKKSAFDLLDLQNVRYAVELQKYCGDDKNVRKRYLNEQQVAVFAKLKHLATGNVIVAAVTHITCKFSEPDIQIAQIAVLLETLDQFATSHSVRGDGRLPVVLCGDFNMTPYSTGYEFIRTGGIVGTHPDIRPNDHTVMPFLVGHPLLDGSRRLLSFANAYVKVCNYDPETTNVKPPFSGCLDYIWCHGLEPFEVLPIGKVSELAREVGLPNSKMPSDHVPIGAKFRFATGL
jgi:mRNA deadenylase 3'-5' endonuclease subunit Ccr4